MVVLAPAVGFSAPSSNSADVGLIFLLSMNWKKESMEFALDFS